MATKVEIPVAITDSVLGEVAGGKFTLNLPRCQLRQCGAEAPLVLSGAGFVDQQPDGDLNLRMFVTEKYDVRKGMNMQGFGAFTSGVLIPASSYYDIAGTAQDNAAWRAERQSINPSFGVGTVIHVSLSHLDKVNVLPRPASSVVKQWFIPGEIELPWHVVTQTGRGWHRDRFESGDDEFAWAIKQSNGGMDVRLTVKNGQALELHATRFMQALEMLCGRVLRPLVESTISGTERIVRIHRQPKPERSSLAPPVQLRHFEPGDAHRFISCCLHRAEQTPAMEDQVLVLYRFWWRILRSYQSDIENSSLVLSVAIEGVLHALFLSEQDADPEFSRLVATAKPVIEQLRIDERVRSSILASLTHTAASKPQETMWRLKEQGVLEEAHIKAWRKMRHKGAHGAMLEDDLEKYQEHLDRYHCCLDLFYRLVFTAVRYRGGFINYSTRGWPPGEFPPGAGSGDQPPGRDDVGAASDSTPAK